MKRPLYTRYTLRLTGRQAATASELTGQEPVDGLEDNPGARLADSPASRPAAAQVDPVDDWSGSAAYAPGADPQTLEYTHPDAVEAILALQPAGWQEEDDGRTLVFWLEDGAAAGAEGAAAGTEVAAALRRIGTLGRLEVRREPPGWETAWQRFHKPHVVGRLYVRPPWYPARDDLLDVAVEAGQAFGTGGHASTRQCLELIQTLPPGSLLDLGSGSGVVSLAALRLGFAPVTGIEIDPVAVHSAAGNAAMNGLEPTFLVGDATDPAYPLPEADVVVANIALRPILRLAERWRGAGDAAADDAPAAGASSAAGTTADGGPTPPAVVLLSGLLVEQADQALAAFPAFEEAARVDDGTWLTLQLSRRA